VGDAGDRHVDAVALEGDALGPEAFALAWADGEGAVGADHAPPGKVAWVLLGGEDAGAQAGGAGRDVAVGGDEALRDRADRVDDLGVALVGDAGVVAGRRSAVEAAGEARM